MQMHAWMEASEKTNGLSVWTMGQRGDGKRNIWTHLGHISEDLVQGIIFFLFWDEILMHGDEEFQEFLELRKGWAGGIERREGRERERERVGKDRK